MLERQIATWNPTDRTNLKWARLVQVTLTLPLMLPHQLIPQSPRFTTFRVVSGVTAAALVLAMVLAGQIGIKLLNQKELTALQRAEIEALRPEVEQLQARETEFKQLQAGLAKFESSPTAYGQFLKSVGQHLPSSLVLTRLQVDASGFTLAGGVTNSDAVVSDWSRWTDQLASESMPWTVAENTVAASSSDFRLKGHWR